jgi:hypothetical protein
VPVDVDGGGDLRVTERLRRHGQGHLRADHQGGGEVPKVVDTDPWDACSGAEVVEAA